jgi:hypothetical protein
MDPVRVQRTERKEGVWERAPHVVAPGQSPARSRSRTQAAPYARRAAPCLPGVGCEARRSTPRGVECTAARRPCRACVFFRRDRARAPSSGKNASGGTGGAWAALHCCFTHAERTLECRRIETVN